MLLTSYGIKVFCLLLLLFRNTDLTDLIRKDKGLAEKRNPNVMPPKES